MKLSIMISKLENGFEEAKERRAQKCRELAEGRMHWGTLEYIAEAEESMRFLNTIIGMMKRTIKEEEEDNAKEVVIGLIEKQIARDIESLVESSSVSRGSNTFSNAIDEVNQKWKGKAIQCQRSIVVDLKEE